MSAATTVEVRVIVRNANERNSDVMVRDFIRIGQSIPERINVVAAEAAATANTALALSDNPIMRDRT